MHIRKPLALKTTKKCECVYLCASTVHMYILHHTGSGNTTREIWKIPGMQPTALQAPCSTMCKLCSSLRTISPCNHLLPNTHLEWKEGSNSPKAETFTISTGIWHLTQITAALILQHLQRSLLFFTLSNPRHILVWKISQTNHWASWKPAQKHKNINICSLKRWTIKLWCLF